MNAQGKAPVEALSRAGWERVEAGLFERLDRGEHRLLPDAQAPARTRLRPWWGIALAAAALAAIGLRSLSAPLAQTPTVAVRSGPPPVTHVATTDASTRTTIGEATLTLGARSEMRFAGSDAEGWLVQLVRGEVDCEVAPRHGRPPFVVLAGTTRVTVVGTRFTVSREGSEEHVRVREGHVHVESGADDEMLGPGDAWPSEPPVISSESLPEVLVPAPEARSAPAPRAAAPRHAARHARSAARDRAAQFETAARLEASDPEAASAIYRELAAGRGPWAANALYAQARLEVERGRTARALKLLHRYRGRYPGGSNAADVAALLQRIRSVAPDEGQPPAQPGAAGAPAVLPRD